jgi:ribonuclease HI
VGVGFQIYKGMERFRHDAARLPDFCTVFQAEIYAIEMAAKSLLMDVNESMRYLKFYTDLQAALMALNDRNTRHSCVNKAKIALNNLSKKVRYLTIVWTKAHVGTVGNERADELAKNGTEGECIIEHGIPWTTVKSRAETYWRNMWDKEWEEYKYGRMTKQFFPCQNKAKTKNLLKFGTRKLGLIVRAISGHCALNYFCNKIDSSISPLCRYCGLEDETFWHFCNSCPVTRASVEDILLMRDVLLSEWSVDELCAILNINVIAMALEGWTVHDLDWEELEGERPDPEPD